MSHLSTSVTALRLRARAGLLCVSALLFASTASAQVVISQVYGGGGNSGAVLKNDYIELFNRGAAAVDLTGWSVQYASTVGTSWQKTNLAPIVLQPGQYYLVQEAAGTGGTVSLPTPDTIGSIAMSASAGKVVLLNTQTLTGAISCPSGSTVVDIVGYGIGTNCVEGAGPTPTLSNTTAALRASAGCTDTNSNSADFAAGAPTPRNSASTLNVCTASTPPVLTSPTAAPSLVVAGYDSLLTVTVTPGTNPASTGLAVTGDLSAIGGSATQSFYDDGTHGDVTAGDKVFSFLATVAPATTNGAKSIPVTVTDTQSRAGNTTISLTVQPPPTCTPTATIADIQGSGNTSPLVATSVTFKGVVTYRRTNGVFVQSITPDGDDATSDGVFVFTSSPPFGDIVAGKTVCVTGKVVEFIPASDATSPPLTEIGSTPTVSVLLETNPMPAPRVITSAEPLGSIVGGVPYMERFEGMRVQIDRLITVSPNLGNSPNETNATGSDTNVFYGIVSGLARPFREVGLDINDPVPVGAPASVPVFDSNPERIRVDARGWSSVLVTSGATITNLVGPVDYAFRTYSLLPESAPAISGLMTPVKVPAPTANEVTVASFNMERFYDTTADPDTSDAVLTATAFANRLNKASLIIRTYLRSPDVLAVQELENLATLQAIADKVNADAVAAGSANPGYTAYLEEGNDIGGIDVGFLVRSRITVGSVTQIGKTDTYINPVTGLPETLHDRPPLVLEASLLRPGSTQVFGFTVIANHLRSLNGVTDADGRVRAKRRAQAEAVATLVQDRLTANPNERIVVVGDFNAYQFNDGYVDVIGTIKGTPTPADQVVLASADLLNPDLRNLADSLGPFGQQYSYIFDGNAQTLDHALANEKFWRWVSRVSYARVDADFPESYRSDPNRPERLSDHDPSITYVAIGKPRIAGTATASPIVGTTKTVKVRLSNRGGANAWSAMLNGFIFRTVSGTGAVTLQGCTVVATSQPCAFPLPLGDLAPGGFADVNLVLDVPTGVTRFSITEQGAFTEPGGTTLRFSAAQSVVR